MPCSLPRWSGSVHDGYLVRRAPAPGYSRSAPPSPLISRVGAHIAAFEDCSSFTRITACQVARPPFRGLSSRGFRYPRYQEYLLAKLSNLTINYSSGLVPTGNLPLWGTQTSLGAAGTSVALSLVLLIGAGLMLETFAKLATIDTGFDKNQVLLIRVDPRYASVPPDRRLPLYQELQRRLATVSGVRSASFADITPVSGSFSSQAVHVDGYMAKPGEDSVVWTNSISSGFFATMETPFIAGRDFDAHDTLQAPLVAVVSESMANKFFGSPRDAVGKTFRQGGNEISPIQIVGVVKDAKYRSLRAEEEAIAYYPLSQLPPMRWANFVLRASGPAASLIPSVKVAVDEVNRDITLQFRTLSVQLDESLGRERLLATLSGFFGALALALAVIGLYGVMSNNVARRRNEIGIRMALGAEQARVLRMVLREVAILLVAGLALGLAVAVFSTRLLASFLYRLERNDPMTLVTACVVLAVSAVVAGFLPARRAANLDPMTALREE